MPKFQTIFQRHLIIKSQRKSQFIQKKALRAFSYELAYFSRRNINTTLPGYLKPCNKLIINTLSKQFLSKLSHFIRRVKTLTIDITFLKAFFTHTHNLKNLLSLTFTGCLLPQNAKLILPRKLKPIPYLKLFENLSVSGIDVSRLAKFAPKLMSSSQIVPSPFRIRNLRYLGIDLVKDGYKEEPAMAILKNLWDSITNFRKLKTLEVSVILTPERKALAGMLNFPQNVKKSVEYKLNLYLRKLEKSRTLSNPIAAIIGYIQKLETADQIFIKDLSYTRQISLGNYQDELIRSDQDYVQFIKMLVAARINNLKLEHIGYYSHINNLITKMEIANMLKQPNIKVTTLYLNYSMEKYNPNTFATFEKLILLSKNIKNLAFSFENLHDSTVKEFSKILSKVAQAAPACILILNCKTHENLRTMYPLAQVLEKITSIKEIHLKVKQNFNAKTFKDLAEVLKAGSFKNKISKFTLELINSESMLTNLKGLTYGILEFLGAYTKNSAGSKSFEMEIHVPADDLGPQDPKLGDHLGFLNVLVAKIFPINFNIGFQPF